MSMTATDLNARRESMLDNDPGASAKTKSETRKEQVLKWFTPEEKIAIIKEHPASITIGSGDEARVVVVRPLSPKQFVEAYALIKTVLLPIVDLYKPGLAPPGMTQLVDALGENIAQLPKLITLILKRGNDISDTWIDEQLDFILDLQLILPHFIEQNGLLHLFAGNAVSPNVAATKEVAALPADQQTQD